MNDRKLTPEQESLAQALHQESRPANGKIIASLEDAQKMLLLLSDPSLPKPQEELNSYKASWMVRIRQYLRHQKCFFLNLIRAFRNNPKSFSKDRESLMTQDDHELKKEGS